jgi:O-antigen/teichoic acid export membrane protein
MNRSRNAVIAATFTYSQLAAAVVAGLVVGPVLVQGLGGRTYGLWLATGEVLAYAGLLDLGVVAMLPWLVAQAEGRRDAARLRALLSAAITIAAAAGAAVGLLALAVWRLVPAVLRLAPADFDALSGPLALVVAATALTYPLRVFGAALVGLQDVRFTGSLGILQTLATLGGTLWLLAEGHGLYAVALPAALAPAVGGLAGLLRLRWIRPALLRAWPRPDPAAIRWMVVEGAAAWASSVGWTMVAASCGLVIAFLGHPEAVVVYACTAKLGQLLFQLARVLPDSGLVALAHIDGEGARDRVARAVGMILRVHLLLGGVAALGVLAFNPLFVRAWVGAELFGGAALNGALTAGLVVTAFVHGLVCCAAVLGHRRAVGGATLACGLLNVALAVVLGRLWGLPGVALAPVASALLTTLPAGVLLVGRAAGLSARRLARDVWLPWAVRLVPLVVVVAAIASPGAGFGGDASVVIAAGALALAAYAWSMRFVYPHLPLPGRLRAPLGWLAAASAPGGRVGEAKP